jgi:hypothetical protein
MSEEHRMYVLVPYNLSPIQQGIQAAHAIAELSLPAKARYAEWVKNHKTIIILNAGTTGEGSSMYQHKDNLDKLDVEYATFSEPDLNDAMTAIAFVVKMNKDSHVVGYLKTMKLA